MNNFEEINNQGELFLMNIYEPTDNSLTIEVREAFTSPVPQDVVVGDKVFNDCYKVSINEYGTSFNISFTNYVAYQVLNESFYNFNDNRSLVAGKYSTYEFVLKETYADVIYPGELKHYGLYCPNHIIHVISLNEPVITKNDCT